MLTALGSNADDFGTSRIRHRLGFTAFWKSYVSTEKIYMIKDMKSNHMTEIIALKRE
jgi:hypothetical protein